jgi:hypothetical protein
MEQGVFYTNAESSGELRGARALPARQAYEEQEQEQGMSTLLLVKA